MNSVIGRWAPQSYAAQHAAAFLHGPVQAPVHHFSSLSSTGRSSCIPSAAAQGPAGGNSGQGKAPRRLSTLSPEEEQFYEQFLEQKKQERMSARKAVSRRVKEVNGVPLDRTVSSPAPPAAPMGSEPQAPAPQTPPPQSPPAPRPLAANPKPATAPAVTPTQAVSTTDLLEDDVELDMDAFAAMANKVLANTEVVEAEFMDEGDSAAASRQRSRSSAAAGPSSRTALPAGKPGIARTPKPAYKPRKMMPIDEMQAAMKELQAGIDEDEEVVEDDLDWEALEQFESFEKYVNEASREASSRAAAAAARAAAAKGSSSGTAANGPAASSANSTSGAFSKTGKAGSKKQKAALLDFEDDDELAELEQLLNLFELVDKESQAASGKAKRKNAQNTTTSASEEASTSGAGDLDVDVDWSVIERLFLGEGWDADIQDMARRAQAEAEAQAQAQAAAEAQRQQAARVSSGAEASTSSTSQLPATTTATGTEANGAGSAAIAQQGQQQQQEEVEEVPWKDEVTTLLLSLVSMSAKRYLGRELLGRDVSEEERAQAYWEAPFALLVQDDSPESCLEYANQAALRLLGCEFEDVFERTSYDVVHPDPSAQQDWLWICNEANERLERHASLPALRMAGAGGRGFTARDVVVFRLDSLEGSAIGQVVVFSAWDMDPLPAAAAGAAGSSGPAAPKKQ